MSPRSSGFSAATLVSARNVRPGRPGLMELCHSPEMERLHLTDGGVGRPGSGGQARAPGSVTCPSSWWTDSLSSSLCPVNGGLRALPPGPDGEHRPRCHRLTWGQSRRFAERGTLAGGP